MPSVYIFGRLIDDIVECKGKKIDYSRPVKNRLIDDIVECKDSWYLLASEGLRRLIDDIVECKVPRIACSTIIAFD